MQAGHDLVTLRKARIDLRAKSPDYDPGTFRSDLGLDPAMPLVVTVGRRHPRCAWTGCSAPATRSASWPAGARRCSSPVVGDGPSRPLVARAADRANARACRPRCIALARTPRDPRPAYAAADVILGMGASALRGLAFGKPLVVQGDAATGSC